MLREKVQCAQQGSKQDMLDLLEQFMPLLKKYAQKLMTEDALSDLTVKLFESINAIKLEQLKSTQDGVFVKYIAVSVKNAYITLLKEILKEKGGDSPISWEGLTEAQIYSLTSDEKAEKQLQGFMDRSTDVLN